MRPIDVPWSVLIEAVRNHLPIYRRNLMFMQTRRNFLQSATAALITSSALLSSRHLLASPFGLPIGLQLYSVREMLAKDYEGTLKQLATLGYQEVEAAGFFDLTPH